jgi:D-alanine-D-alanine ligase
MNKKINVAVLIGGKSPEYDVSLSSGKNILKNIDRYKFNVFPLIFAKDGRDDDLKRLVHLCQTSKIDICFIAMHGPYGEGGSLQRKLDKLNIRYTGSGYETSKLGMNKISFKKLMDKNKIYVPKQIVFKKGDNLAKKVSNIKYPCFIKPASQGSSVGASKAVNSAELKKAINLALKYDLYILIEEYLSGMEITVPVLGNQKPIALPLIEIKPKKGNYFNYESKYSIGGSDEIIPARISESLTKEIQKIAIKIYQLCNCRGFSRIDFIIKDGVTPVVLEINTIPGLTKMSLFPKSASVAGISMTELISKIIYYALE